ncbi:MAG: hypothetical protein JSS89_03745 [Bacteroidetes bacterium]|nr:hypothetical protein [Bacteroidota bacterium]
MARRPFWRRAISFVIRWSYRLVFSATIFFAILIGIAQTDSFRSWLRTVVIEQVNAQLVGSLAVDDVRIDIWKGIYLAHPQLYAHGTTVLEADAVSVTYDIAPLLRNVVAINSVQLDRPRINVLRSATDSVWNVARIVKPPADTTSSPPPDLHIYVRELKITDGTIVINDRTQRWGDGTRFDPMHMSMRHVNLSATARLALKAQDYEAAINHLSFEETTSPLTVHDLSLAAHVSTSGVNLQALHLRTARSDVNLRARINDINIFDGFNDDSLRTHPAIGSVDADVVDAQEVHYFVPDVDILGLYSVDADLVFGGETLNIRNLSLSGDDLDLHGEMDAMNLSGAKPLAVNIKAFNTHASYSDVRRRLRFVPLPELPFLRHATIESVWLRGVPDDSLWFEVHASDAPGRIDGTMSVYLKGPRLGYNLDAMVRNGDLSVFSADSSLSSNINGHVRVQGKGVTLQDVEARADLDLEATSVNGTRLRSLSTTIRGNGAGRIDLDSLNVVFASLKKGEGGEDVDDATVRQTASVRGMLNAAVPGHLGYDMSVAVQDLNLAALLHDDQMPSRLSSDVTIRGHDIELDSMEAELHATTTEFMLKDRAMMPFTTDVVNKRQDGRRTISFDANSVRGRHPILSARVDGDYAPSALLDVISAMTTTTADLVVRSVRHVAGPARPVRVFAKEIQPMQAAFRVVAYDVSPLAVFIPDVHLMFTGSLNGSISASAGGISFALDTASIRDLRIASDSLLITADPFVASIHARTNNIVSVPTLDSLSIHATCDSVLQVGTTKLLSPTIGLSVANNKGSLRASSGVNEMHFGVVAGVALYDEMLSLQLDSMEFTLDPTRNLLWRTTQPSTITASNKVYNVQGLVAQRPFAETITITGLLSDSIFANTNVVVENFNLRDILKYAPALTSSPLKLLRGFMTKATATVNGTWRDPVITLDLAAKDVSYNAEKIGALNVSLKHAERNVTGTATITSGDSTKLVEALNLKINTVPLDLGFVNVPQRMIDGRPIDIQLLANKLSMAVVEPFLPAIERLRGQADAMISVKGTTPNDVKFTGNARFKNATFIASSTGMSYNADGVMRLEGEQLLIDTIVARNLARDILRKDNKGIANATGTVTFNGLSVESVDFTVTTPGLAVMNMQSVARSPDVYGDVVVASGKSPLHFYGRLDAPHLDGDLIVIYGDVIFPQERSSTKRRVTSFTYISPDDSLNYAFPSLEDRVRPRSRQDTTRREPADSSQIVRALQSAFSGPKAGFMDLLEFNLNVYFKSRFLLTMVLGVTEILIADLELSDPRIPLEFTGSFGSGTNMHGKMKLKEGTSTYKFFKPFSASGELDFSAGGLTNPSLKLRAVYIGNRMLPPPKGGREDYRVVIDITGTKQLPEAKFRLFRNDKEVVGTDSNYVKSDALMLILLNRTQDELQQGGQGNVVGEVNASLSAVATNALGEMLAGVGGVIQNAQLDVGSDISQSKLTLSGQLFGNVTYRWSGTVSDISANNNITVILPLSELNEATLLKYLELELSRAVSNTGNVTRYQKEWEVKLGIRLP